MLIWCLQCETLTQGQDPSSGPCVSAAAFDAPSTLSTVKSLNLVTKLTVIIFLAKKPKKNLFSEMI
jgi:hypothetical protein